MKRLAGVVCLLLLAGCSGDDPGVPAACLTDPGTFARALHAAPSPVRVGGVGISDCLPEGSSTGDIQSVGVALVEAAQRLGKERDSVGLGYLVGALRRRSEGVHLELVRRIEQEASPFARSAGFERGRRAGRSSG